MSEGIREKYLKYVNENRDRVQKQYRMIEKILDEKFDLVYSFFYEVLEREEKYKVLRARRCQVLFHIFVPLILLNEEDVAIQGTFISDNSMIKFREEILKCPTLIVDDILIHGRGLKTLYESLDPDYSHNNISIFVLYKSKQTTHMKGRLAERLVCGMEVFDWEWRELSCAFVNAIYASASPYISFVSSYEKEGLLLSESEDELLVYQNDNQFQTEQKEQSSFWFEKKESLAFFNQIGYDSCFRVYENRYLEKITCIPYVFIKNFSIETYRVLFDWVCQRIAPDKIRAVKTELLSHARSDGEIEYQVRLFAALINQIYGLYLQNAYVKLRGLKLDLATLEVAYGAETARELSQLNLSDVHRVLSDSLPETVVDSAVVEDSELIDIYKDSMRENLLIFPLYFYQNGRMDEIRARSGLDRKKGLTTDCFYRGILNVKKHEISKGLLQSWDSGIASCNVRMSDSKQIIAFYSAAGEQSFRYLFEMFSEEIEELITSFNSPLFNYTNPKSSTDLVYECLDKLRKENDEKGGDLKKTDFDLLYDFVKENASRIGIMGLPQIS